MAPTSDERREVAERLRCGRCMHCRSTGGGMCLVYGSRVSADEHHVTHRSAITGEDCGCEDFYTPEAYEEWCRAHDLMRELGIEVSE